MTNSEIACLMFEGKIKEACGIPNVLVVEFNLHDTPQAFAKSEIDFLRACVQICNGGKHGVMLLFKDAFVYSVCFHGHFLSYLVDPKRSNLFHNKRRI